VAAGPVDRDTLAGHLGMIRLPVRTTALLDRVGSGAPTRPALGDPDRLGGKAASGPRDAERRDARERKAVDSSVASMIGSLDALALDLLAERLTRLLDRLLDATEQPDMTSLARALSGLGPGLTPTGDDLLVGIAAACHRLVAGGYWSAVRRDALAAALAGMGDTGTTTVAREMVGEAAAGRFPEVLASFVELLGDRDMAAEQVQAAAGRLAATGAHSGADMLAGVIAVAARAGRDA
jgi:hypothetical protein